MAEQFDKIMQDGRVSFVPRSNKTRLFWTKYNAKVAGSQNAAKETVTLVPATEEEVAEWRRESEPIGRSHSTVATPPVNSPILEDLQKQMQKQQEQIKQQQEMITRLLAMQAGSEQNEEISGAPGKPGRKPKTENNGESKQTEPAAQA